MVSAGRVELAAACELADVTAGGGLVEATAGTGLVGLPDSGRYVGLMATGVDCSAGATDFLLASLAARLWVDRPDSWLIIRGDSRHGIFGPARNLPIGWLDPLRDCRRTGGLGHRQWANRGFRRYRIGRSAGQGTISRWDSSNYLNRLDQLFNHSSPFLVSPNLS